MGGAAGPPQEGLCFCGGAQAQRAPRRALTLPAAPPCHPAAGCTWSAAGVSCAIDAEYIHVTQALRAALPRPYLLTSAVWSTGAYGQGAWLNSGPQGDHTGQSVNLLKQAGSALDQIQVMSYDASNAYSPTVRAPCPRSPQPWLRADHSRASPHTRCGPPCRPPLMRTAACTAARS